MTKRYVTLGGGKVVSLGRYVAAIRIAKACPDQTFKHGLTGWWPVTGAEIVREFRAGMVARINSGRPRCESWSGRKI